MCFQEHIRGALCCLALTVKEDTRTVAAMPLPGAIWTLSSIPGFYSPDASTHLLHSDTPRSPDTASAAENLDYPPENPEAESYRLGTIPRDK